MRERKRRKVDPGLLLERKQGREAARKIGMQCLQDAQVILRISRLQYVIHNMSICLSVCIYLSVCLSVCLFVCLSVCWLFYYFITSQNLRIIAISRHIYVYIVFPRHIYVFALAMVCIFISRSSLRSGT